MVLLERTGKAIRSPAKSVLLAVAARNVGRGRGFGVHKALDQTGAFLGPLLVAGVVAVTPTSGPACWCSRCRAPSRSAYCALDASVRRGPAARAHPGRGRLWSALPRTFYVYAVACALTTMGLMTFGVISFHLVNEHLVTAAVVPVVYAAAMGADALASLGTGFAYDRVGGGTLLLLPVVVAAVPALVFTDRRRARGRRRAALGSRRPASRTPRSRPWSPTSSPPRGWPRRTAPSRRSRPWRRSPAASSPGGCTTCTARAGRGDRGRPGGGAGAAGRRCWPAGAPRTRAVRPRRARVRSMSATPSSYSITMRLHTAPDHGVVGAVATAIAAAGGIVTAIDVADSSHDRLVVDVTCSAADADHAEVLVAAVSEVEGVEVHKVSDRTFLLHIGGKIEVTSKVPLRTRDDLSMAYTPGVGRVSLALAKNPEDVSPADHQGQLRRGRHRRLGRARARQHRPRRRAAGDGGQGRAVQAVRRHRRLADLPGHPGHRRDRAAPSR